MQSAQTNRTQADTSKNAPGESGRADLPVPGIKSKHLAEKVTIAITCNSLAHRELISPGEPDLSKSWVVVCYGAAPLPPYLRWIVHRLPAGLKEWSRPTRIGSGGGMICPRCHCLLVEDRFMDWAARWRCLKCGHVQDSASVEHQLARLKKDLFLKCVNADYWDEEVHFEPDIVPAIRTNMAD
jgi:hypothetical protein